MIATQLAHVRTAVTGNIAVLQPRGLVVWIVPRDVIHLRVDNHTSFVLFIFLFVLEVVSPCVHLI